MSARNEKLERLAERRRRIDAQIECIKAEETVKERKRDARRKIVVGAMVLAMVERGEWPRERLLEKLDTYLTRDHDRALFDLAPAPLRRGDREKRAG